MFIYIGCKHFLPSVTQSVTSAGWERKTWPGSYLCITNIESVTNKYITLHVCACISWCINLTPTQAGHKDIRWRMMICRIKPIEGYLNPYFQRNIHREPFTWLKLFCSWWWRITFAFLTYFWRWQGEGNISKWRTLKVTSYQHPVSVSG